ncbi:MAG: MBL fold metallo-hydrolase [Dehalococcoidales bacterium]|nr:MBL fold metallo-hydrolase [Dehalococcoidales bacterium]
MKVKWLGHASFLITSEAGTKIITDPYNVGSGLSYGEIREAADIVTVSHEHGDHNNVAAVKGSPQVVKGAGAKEAKGIKFKGISTYHDEAQGGQRGPNTVFCFEVDGLKVCHLGDLGHALSDKDVAEVGKVDILLVPVGGFFTIDARVATAVSGKLAPKVIIPMHFKNDKLAYPIAAVDDFIKGKSGVTQPNASEVEFKRGKLPAATQIVVLKPAL